MCLNVMQKMKFKTKTFANYIEGLQMTSYHDESHTMVFV